MANTSIVKQIPVYIAKNSRLFRNQRDWKFIVIAAVISFLVCSIVGENMFSTYEATKSGFFAIISASIWIGVFNSIQRICKEHPTITAEYRAGAHITSYVISHILFDLMICFVQSLLMMIICEIYIDFPEEGIIFQYSVIEYFITIFLVIWCSDIMGIMISSVASTPNAAMTAMPFVLILQLVMSGVLFELNGWSEKIAYITFSKWGMSALGSIGNLNNEELPLKMSLVFPQVVRLESEAAYSYTTENLLKAWGCIALIGFACASISIISLKFRNRGA